MKRFRWSGPAAALVLLVVAAPGARTQQDAQVVGRIDRIVEILGARDVRQLQQSTSRAQVRPAGATAWVDVAPGRGLLHGERLRVARYLDLRLRVRRSAEQGTLVFLPEVWERGGRNVFTAGAQSGQRAPEGSYRVRTAPPGAGDLTVEIERGSLVVNWDHGRLAVVAAGTLAVISGTRLAVMVDSTGGGGAVFVDEGEVSFPDFPAARLRPGQWAVLRRGLPPQVLSLTAANQKLARRAVRHHADGIWGGGGPSWKQIATVAVAAVGVAVIATQAGDRPAGAATRTGTVVVRVPRISGTSDGPWADSVTVLVTPEGGASQRLWGELRPTGDGSREAYFPLTVRQGRARFTVRYLVSLSDPRVSRESTHEITRDDFVVTLP